MNFRFLGLRVEVFVSVERHIRCFRSNLIGFDVIFAYKCVFFELVYLFNAIVNFRFLVLRVEVFALV